PLNLAACVATLPTYTYAKPNYAPATNCSGGKFDEHYVLDSDGGDCTYHTQLLGDGLCRWKKVNATPAPQTAQASPAPQQPDTVIIVDNRCRSYLCEVRQVGPTKVVVVDHLCGKHVCGEWHGLGYYVGGFLLATYQEVYGYDIANYGFGYSYGWPYDRHLGYWSGGCYQRCRGTISCSC